MPKYQIEISLIKEKTLFLFEHPDLEQALTHAQKIADAANARLNGDYHGIDVTIKEHEKGPTTAAVRFSAKKDKGDDAQ